MPALEPKKLSLIYEAVLFIILPLPERKAHGRQQQEPAKLSSTYRLVVGASFISRLGSWLSFTALPLVMLQTPGHGAQWLTTYYTGTAVVMAIFSLVGGDIADRFFPRQVVFTAQMVIVVESAVVWHIVATGSKQFLALIGWEMLNTVASALQKPAQKKLLIGLVADEGQERAVAINSLLQSISMVVGPAIAGIALIWVEPEWLLLADVFSFLPLLSILPCITISKEARKEIPKAPKEQVLLLDAARYAWRNKTLRLVLPVYGLMVTLCFNLNIVGPLLASNVFHVRDGYGLILAVEGVGQVLPLSLIALKPHLHQALRPGLVQMLVWGGIYSLLWASFAASPWFPLALALLLPASATCGLYLYSTEVLLQTTPDEVRRGRIIGLGESASWLGSVIGQPLTLALISLCGISMAVAIESTVAISALSLLALRQRRQSGK